MQVMILQNRLTDLATKRCIKVLLLLMTVLGLLLCACTNQSDGHKGKEDTASPAEVQSTSLAQSSEKESNSVVKTGYITKQILNRENGEIHYSYYLPEDYDSDKKYPMMVTMPGYDMMWFGEKSSENNLKWSGFTAWTEFEEDMIVVSAQLTDWAETSAKQAIELTEYFVDNFSVDKKRIYAAGYSAGGETMSQAVSLRPDLYAAYLHGASQWDGTFAPIAENKVAVYIYMAKSDEYYGSQKAQNAYDGLFSAYEESGLTQNQIDRLLQMQLPDDKFFNDRGIYNYHGGANVLFDDKSILNWITSQHK